jgi:hypothetical protein
MTEQQFERAAEIKREIDEAQKWINNLPIMPNLCHLNDYLVTAHQFIPSMDFKTASDAATRAAVSQVAYMAMERIVLLKLEAASL